LHSARRNEDDGCQVVEARAFPRSCADQLTSARRPCEGRPATRRHDGRRHSHPCSLKENSLHSTGKAARLAASSRQPIPSERPLPRQLKHSSGRLVMAGQERSIPLATLTQGPYEPISGSSRSKDTRDAGRDRPDAGIMDQRILRRAALITLRRAILERFPPGPERT
jgi:hypothetical protein